jgi:hypothetical protein
MKKLIELTWSHLLWQKSPLRTLEVNKIVRIFFRIYRPVVCYLLAATWVNTTKYKRKNQRVNRLDLAARANFRVITLIVSYVPAIEIMECIIKRCKDNYRNMIIYWWKYRRCRYLGLFMSRCRLMNWNSFITTICLMRVHWWQGYWGRLWKNNLIYYFQGSLAMIISNSSRNMTDSLY